MRHNPLKARLRDGQTALGVSLMIPSPQMVEMVGRLGFDWVLLDCEHGTISLESLELMVMAAEAAGITPLARPRSSRPEAILEVLERGVAGVQVPHVNTADQARDVVAAVKYHPLGRRGLAARTRPAGYGIGVSLQEYAGRANEETLICVQIEESQALDNLDDLLRVEEVDVFFLGPSDLSQSLGHPGDLDHPEVRSALERAITAITSAGKAAGSAGDAERCRQFRRQGVSYLYTHLPALLASAGQAFIDGVAQQ